MKSKKIFVIIFLLLIHAVWVSQVLAFTKDIHQVLNRNIANRTITGFSLNDYLINHLGFEKGVGEIIYAYSGKKGKDFDQTVSEWLAEGGYMEDEPEGFPGYLFNTARNNRHFHNPLGSWDNAGLRTPIFKAQSSVMWAQNQNQDVGGKWSWYDARDYFYKGLTATSKAQRED